MLKVSSKTNEMKGWDQNYLVWVFLFSSCKKLLLYLKVAPSKL